MYDDRKEGVNLLNPEVSARKNELNFESHENGTRPAPSQVEAPSVDSRQLTNMKSTIMASALTEEAPQKNLVLLEIEGILAENLGDIYAQLPEDKRQAFKVKGEEVADKIQEMVVTAKVKVHKILKLISEWLHMIPGVNVYFLQQEAKIKLDKVMDYLEEQAKSSQDGL